MDIVVSPGEAIFGRKSGSNSENRFSVKFRVSGMVRPASGIAPGPRERVFPLGDCCKSGFSLQNRRDGRKIAEKFVLYFLVILPLSCSQHISSGMAARDIHFKRVATFMSQDPDCRIRAG